MKMDLRNTNQMIDDIRQELLEYLKEKDLNNLFVSIIEAILRCKPDNPFEFIVNFLKVSLYNELGSCYVHE